jgi:hypothetical protein
MKNASTAHLSALALVTIMACGDDAVEGGGGPAPCSVCETSAWSLSFGHAGSSATVYAVAVGADGEIWLGGGASGPVELQTSTALDERGGVFLGRVSPAGAPLWEQGYADEIEMLNNAVRSLATSSAGDLIVGADAVVPWDFGGPVDVEQRLVVARVARDGTIAWRRQFGGPDTGSLDVAVNADDHVVVVGKTIETTDFGAGPVTVTTQSPFALELDADGGHVWSEVFSAADAPGYASSVAIGAGGSIYFSGTAIGTLTIGSTVVTEQPYLAKLAADGTVQWTVPLDPSLVPRALVAADDGGVLMVGRYYNNMPPVELGGVLPTAEGDDEPPFAARFDAQGGVLWARGVPGKGAADFSGAALGRDGLLHVCGHFRGVREVGGDAPLDAGTGGADILYMAFAADDGQVARARDWGENNINDMCTGIDTDGAGNVILAGEFGGTIDFGSGPLTAKGEVDGFVAKLVPGDF